MEDELTLIRSAQIGNEEAWDILEKRYSKVAWAATLRYNLSFQEREDIVQEVFLKLTHSICNYNPNKARLSTFIAVIAKRTAIDRLRKIQRDPVDILPTEDLEKFPSPLEEEPSYTTEMIELLNTALNERLTTEQRLVIILFYFEKCSYKQIERLMGKDKHGVKNLLHRTKAYLGVATK